LERILKHKLRRILPPPASPPSKEELREASKRAKEKARRAAEAAVGRNIRKRIELGIQLAELRDATPNNKRVGNIVRKQFDIHDSLLVGEVQCVARRYGDRQEITEKVRNWNVLVALASQLLPPAACRAFEEMILAGKRVTAKSIAAKASGRARKSGRPSKATVRRAAGRYTHAHDRR
jgi:hypothetical protein